MLVHAKNISKQQINPTGIEIAAVKKKMPYSALRLFWLITVCVRSVSLQLHIPHPSNRVNNTTLNQVQENTGEISSSKILCPFCIFNLIS